MSQAVISPTLVDSILESYHHSELDQVEPVDESEFVTTLEAAQADESKMGELVDEISVRFKIAQGEAIEATNQAILMVSKTAFGITQS